MHVTCICGQPCSLPLVASWKAKRGSASAACQSQPRDCSASQAGHCTCTRPCLRHIPAPVTSQQPSLPPLGWCPQEKGTPADSLEASEASWTGGDPTDLRFSPGFITYQLCYFNSQLHFPPLENGNNNAHIAVL